MADITIDSLTREQISQVDRILDVLGVPNEVLDTISSLIVIKAVELWFLKKQQALRMEERGNG